MRAIDFHVHLPTPEWLDVSMAGYIEAAERYFRSQVSRRTPAEVAAEYEKLDIVALLLAWDAESATHRPRLSNEYVAQAVADFPDRFVGFGSVDPLKGDEAVRGLDRIHELGLRGVKFHPSIQRFAPEDEDRVGELEVGHGGLKPRRRERARRRHRHGVPGAGVDIP